MILSKHHRHNAFRLRGLYLVTPDWDDTEEMLRISQAALEAGANILQYRHKHANAVLRLEQAKALSRLCQRLNKIFIINDHIELFQQVDADGLHLGCQDTSIKKARALLGEKPIIGASCYGDFELAKRAKEAGASYLALGGFYPSKVKQYAVSTSPELISQVRQQLDLPIAVIGGMNLDNSQILIQKGSDMVAAISSIYAPNGLSGGLSDDVTQLVKNWTALFASGECP